MKRAISNEFMDSLLNGELSPVLNIVKNDPTLDLEMRGDEVTIYYQALKLLSIKEKGRGVYEYDEINKEYRLRKNDKEVSLPVLSLDNIEDYIIKGKNVIDTYDKKEHFEYEVKQMIVRENNTAPTAERTDFFVIDTEYQNEEGDQFDIVALHINSDANARKKGEASIAIIEIKQDIATLKTTQRNPGIRQHLEDYKKHIADENRKKEFIADMNKIVLQKFELGLFNGLQSNTIQRLQINDEIEFYIVLADYKIKSTNLQVELKSFDGGCKFFTSSFMGYGLYNWAIKSKEEILNMLANEY